MENDNGKPFYLLNLIKYHKGKVKFKNEKLAKLYPDMTAKEVYKMYVREFVP